VLTGARDRWFHSVAVGWPGRRRSPELATILADPRSYERQLDRLLDRHAFGRGIHELREGEVSLASVAARRSEVARLIARTVAAGDYAPAPAVIRTIRVGGKRRVVVVLGLVDLLVHGVVSDALQAAIEPTLSPRLLSYRTGVPWWRGAQQFSGWIRRQREGFSARRQWPGLYVIRRDVSAYTDTIPVDDVSPLWPMIEAAFAGGGSISPDVAAVVRSVVRPAIVGPDGAAAIRDRGVPTGQPISCVLFNLYLRDVDHRLASLPGGFYARYSDDVVFAHPDPVVVQQATATLAQDVVALRLSLNAAKSRDYFLTRAGHASREWPSAQGTQVVPLLGLQVGADGTVGLEPAKARELVRDVRRRAWVAAAAGVDADESAWLACAVVRRALDPGDTQAAARAATLLRHVATDRRQLDELDYRIAREVAGVLVGDRTVRAFRSLPPSLLRSRYGLPSLVDARNGPRRRDAVGRRGRHRVAPVERGTTTSPAVSRRPAQAAPVSTDSA
jgi:hypothetical protein